MPSNVGLYYPYIHFRDEAWLKLAALYWDGMGRIVPHDYPMHDSETVKVLADRLGFIRNVAPTKEVETVGGRFVRLLEAHEDALHEKYGLHHLPSWKPDPFSAHLPPWGASQGLRTSTSERIRNFH